MLQRLKTWIPMVGAYVALLASVACCAGCTTPTIEVYDERQPAPPPIIYDVEPAPQPAPQPPEDEEEAAADALAYELIEQVRGGMSEGDLEELLGRPDGVVGSTWTYANAQNRGGFARTLRVEVAGGLVVGYALWRR